MNLDYKFLNPEQVQEVVRSYFNTSKEIRGQIQIFEVFADPDTNEGRYPARSQGFVLVRFNTESVGFHSHDIKHEDFVSDFLYTIYGNQVTYGMGNYVVKNWWYKTIKEDKKDFLLEIFPKNPELQGIYVEPSAYTLLGVIESLNTFNPIWGKFDFYRKIGWRRD